MPHLEDSSRNVPEMDGARFSQLIIQSQRRMRTLVLAMVPGCRDVDDILQESCAAMWKKIDTFEEGRPFDAWALGFVKMQTLAWLKRRGRDRLQLGGDAIESLYNSINQGEPSRHNKAHLHALEDCLTSLSDSDQSLMKLRYIEGMSVADLVQRGRGKTAAALYKTFSRLQTRLLRCVEGKLKEQAQ